MVPGHARVAQPQVAVRAAAEQRHGSRQLVGVVFAAGRATGSPRPGDQQPRVPGESASLRPRQVDGRKPDLAALYGRAPDDTGPDPERARGHVGHPLEPHPLLALHRIALFLDAILGLVWAHTLQTYSANIMALKTSTAQSEPP